MIAEQPTRRRRPWVPLAVVLALAALAGVFLLGGGGERDGSGPPDAWHPEVAELADYVERERGLDWEHPVHTEFLSRREFRARVTDDSELSAEDAEELDHYEGVFRALGLVAGELDLRAASNQLSGEGIVGVYLPEEDRILVRGDRITTGMRPTIVHELTHALQAQHFDLELEREPSGADLAFRALVEADALRIEGAYIDSLPASERRVVEREQRAQAEGADFEGVPPILTELFSLPYVFGPPFLDAVAAEGGDGAIDRAFRRPPTTEEQLLEPRRYLVRDEPAEVPAPRLRAGEEAGDEPDDFGMLSLLLVLGERLPFPQAWAAVDGWRGDASRTYRLEGADCIRIRVAVDTEADAAELHAAARAWAAGVRSARSSRDGRVVSLSSCDPGTATGSPDTDSQDTDRPRTFELLQLRVELVSTLESNGLDRRVAACVADATLAEHDPRRLLDVATVDDPQDPRLVEVQRGVAAAVQRCQGG